VAVAVACVVVATVSLVVVVVVAGARVVVVVTTGSGCDRSQIPSPFVSSYRLHSPGNGSSTRPLGQSSQASAVAGKPNPYTSPNSERTAISVTVAVFFLCLLMSPSLDMPRRLRVRRMVPGSA